MFLLGQEQRREMEGWPARDQYDVVPYDSGAIWHVGTVAFESWTCNPIHHGNADDCMQFPQSSLSPGISFFEQMETMALNWRYAGWLFNQPVPVQSA